MAGCEVPKKHYDFSAFDYIGTIKVIPDWEKGLKISLGILVDFVAIVGNALVIAIVVKFKKMRTTTNFYLVNLAISDLMVALLPIWIHVVGSMNEFWVFGSFLCKFNPFLQITAMCSAMFTLLVIAGDRFFAIMFPMKSRVTRRKVSYMLTVVWVCSIAVGSPLLYFYVYFERTWKDLTEKNCEDVWPMRRISNDTCDMGIASRKAYWIVVCAVLNWTPMIFMMVAYTFIVIKLRNHKIMPKLGASSKSTIQEKSKRKVVTMLISVMVVFIVCVVPFQFIRIYFLFTQDDPDYVLPTWYDTLDFAAVLLMYSNSAINPIIYGGLNETFRQGLKDLFRGADGRSGGSADYDTDFNARSMKFRNSLTSRMGRRNSSLKRYRNGGGMANGDPQPTSEKPIATIMEVHEPAAHEAGHIGTT